MGKWPSQLIPSSKSENMTTIQVPTYTHIDKILALNRKYLLTHLSNQEKENSFIRIEYSKDDIKRIIDHREIVVALNDNVVIGYYLIGRKSQNPALAYQLKKVIEIFKEPNTADKVGYGAQAILEKNYRGGELLNRMLKKLIQELNNIYTVLFSSVTKINQGALKAHSKGGYKILDEDDTKYYVGLFIDNL